MRHPLLALALALVLPLPGLTADVTVKEGETLSQIAERHGVGLSQLMKLNGISDPDLLKVGQTLKLPDGKPGQQSESSPPPKYSYDRSASEHTVRPRETLSSISRGYGVPLATLLAINDISDPDLVKTGTVLKVKGTPPAKAASQAQAAPKAEAKPATPAANPQPKPAATAQPAPAAAAPAAKASATPPAAEATPSAGGSGRAPDWRKYGPLQVDWSGWQPMGGSLVAPSVNADGLSFYLSINCDARKLNATNKDGQWQTWEDPTADFEKTLVNELCSNPPQ